MIVGAGLQQLTNSLYIDIPLFILMVCTAMVEIMKNKKITYFFSGRKSRIDQSDNYAKEMFYGYHYFKNLDYETDIVEFGTHKTVLANIFF